MGGFEVFVIRLVLAVAFAALASRMFFKTVNVWGVGAFALALLGFAYLSAYLRQKDKGGKHGA